MKKTIVLLLCVFLLTGSALAEEYVFYDDGYGAAQEGQGLACGDQMTWALDGSTLYITGSGEMYDFYSGAPWALYKGSINRVVLSDGITYVGAYAFQDYDSLTSVEFGNSLISIGKDAFLLGDPLAPHRSYITVRCAANSAAAQYCAENRIPCSLTGA